MQRAWRLGVLSTLAALTISTPGCGVEAGDQATSASATTTTTTAARKDRGPGAQDAIDKMTDTYTDLGFSEEDATCLAEGMYDAFGGGGDPTDPSALMDVVNQCDIDASKIMENLGGGSMEDMMRRGLVAGFKNSGMTQEQAECVADAFIDEFGGDASAAADPNNMRSPFEGCGVDPDAIRPGG